MLSQLIERFVKRLCGRWLRGFDGSQVNVSLGGTVTLEDLDLKTEELRALLLPYEPVSASVRRLRLDGQADAPVCVRSVRNGLR